MHKIKLRGLFGGKGVLIVQKARAMADMEYNNGWIVKEAEQRKAGKTF